MKLKNAREVLFILAHSNLLWLLFSKPTYTKEQKQSSYHYLEYCVLAVKIMPKKMREEMENLGTSMVLPWPGTNSLIQTNSVTLFPRNCHDISKARDLEP